MFNRILKPLKTNSLFLFGARGVGKSTLVRHLFADQNTLPIDLLDPAQFEEAALATTDLVARLEATANKQSWIFIDEVQKVPKLLDAVQRLIDQFDFKFILTGSSARKLKRGGANLLAGRAYTYNLYPLTQTEIGERFELDRYLSFGGLPRVWNIDSEAERIIYLRSYVTTYLKEEIAEEQVVRKLEPFGKFLQVAAQSSGQIVNFSNIAKDVGVSDQTVKTYFQILEDTLLGYLLPSYSHSIRKSQGKSPKFYFFDTGVLRALQRRINQPLSDLNYAYGNLFEHFIINEIRHLAEYQGLDFQFSFLRTDTDQEIDLIVDRPGRAPAVVEIKSSNNIREDDVQTTLRLGSDIAGAELYCLSRDPRPKKFGDLLALPWQEGIQALLG